MMVAYLLAMGNLQNKRLTAAVEKIGAKMELAEVQVKVQSPKMLTYCFEIHFHWEGGTDS